MIAFNLDNTEEKSDELTLSEDQQLALEEMLQFVLSDEKEVFSLIGHAGTGKTTVINKLLKELHKNQYYSYVLCAPTHKAKLVLQRLTDCDTCTLHQLLSLSPNLDIMDLDLRYLDFFSNKRDSDTIPSNGLVICDEGSMVNDDLYDYLLKQCGKRNTKIIFIGDQCQIQPVGDNKLSKVFNNPDKFELTTNHRQREDNALLPLIEQARENIIEDFETSLAERGNCYVYTSAKKMMEENFQHFKELVELKDVLHTKILTYTNKRVESFNNAVRRFVYNNDYEYNEDEVLMCYDNFEHQHKKYYNSLDYIILNVIDKQIHIPNFGFVSGYELTLLDTVYNGKSKVDMISRQNENVLFIRLAEVLERLRVKALNCRKGTQAYKDSWKNYYNYFNSFATPYNLEYQGRLVKSKTFDYGYACTIHRSQGSSFNTVFYDNNSLKFCQNLQERRQLQYVALSRTRTDLYILK